MAKDGLELEIELTLALPGGGAGGCCGETSGLVEKKMKKREFTEFSGEETKAGNKNQVVGWPPVCSYRRKNSFSGEERTKMYVKVSMDGAPFLRKIDLSTHEEYSSLLMSLEKLFCCYIGESSEYVPIYEDKDGDWMLVGDVPWQRVVADTLEIFIMNWLTKEGQVLEVKPNIIKMFSGSCKRLRIMKSLDAKGNGLHAKDLLKGISIEA